MLELRDIFANVVGVSLSDVVSLYEDSEDLTNLRFDDIEKLINGLFLLGDTSINSRLSPRHRTSKGIYNQLCSYMRAEKRTGQSTLSIIFTDLPFEGRGPSGSSMSVIRIMLVAFRYTVVLSSATTSMRTYGSVNSSSGFLAGVGSGSVG
jgi:hypothetical protein